MFDRRNSYGTDTMGRGTENYSGVTLPHRDSDVFSGAGEQGGDDESHPATGGNPLTIVFILIGLIVALYFVHKASPVLNTESFGVNWLSFFQVGVMATAFILLEKAFFGRYHIAGITNAVAAI